MKFAFVEKFKELKKKMKDIKLQEKLCQIEHRYYHETGIMLKSDLEEIT